MSLAKKKIAVAVIAGSKRPEIRIQILTSADIVHVLALALGYKPEVAFSLGVISRSIPQHTSGELDVSLEIARATIGLARTIIECRATGTLPDDLKQLEAIQEAIAHMHTIEDCFVRMVKDAPELLPALADQYAAWQTSNTTNTDGLFRRVVKRIFQ